MALLHKVMFNKEDDDFRVSNFSTQWVTCSKNQKNEDFRALGDEAEERTIAA